VDHNIVATLIRRASLAGGIALAASACASTAPTQQLVDARRTYNEAASSEAARLTPDKLLTAQQALEQAERAHNDDPGSPQEAHLAYLAARKSAMAIAYGKIAAAKETEEQSDAKYQEDLRERATSSEAQLSGTQAALEAERQKRQEAEKRAASALQRLTEVAKVNEERRGTVITLPGGVLFPSGGSTLSAPAQQSLERVAEALTEQPIEAQISIEGHTDARGSDARNLELSRQRAEAVRAYLVQKGIDAQRVSAVGKGEAAPIADNESAEGRATNRRVEIVVSAGAAASNSMSTSTSPSTPSPAGSMPATPGAKLTPEAATPTAPPSAVSKQP
jgi:outer membrane protein OmpA-like peptidoglycan-associated protein